MLSKLKYAGISRSDLLTVYKLFIRSVLEYCSVSFHTSLTNDQSRKIEGVQSTCLKVILGEEYSSYESALKICDLVTLCERRQSRFLNFALKCVSDKNNMKFFPKNQRPIGGEIFKVNFTRTTKYQKSTLPQAQRMLNTYFKK